MSVPPRPQHVVTRRQQLHTWRERTFERLRFGRSSRWSEATAPQHSDLQNTIVPSTEISVAPALTGTSLIRGVLVGAALALAGLVAVWGWQTWSGRVSVPIDDRLPMLVTSDETDDQVPIDSPAAPTVAPVAEATAAETTAAETTAAVESEPVVVHVAGAIMVPGVVTLDSGARVIDALEKAGGPTQQADLDRVNLAARVFDGERIHVPALGEDQPPIVVTPTRAGTAGPAIGATTDDTPVLILDINLATAEALEALPGVGPSIAQAIVQTRIDRGPFLSVDELLDVPGIGESKLSQIEPHVQVGR